jgi:hypothetical protein
MFLLHRLPFLWRLQARLASREIVGDALVQLSEGPGAPIPKMIRKAQDVVGRAVMGLALLGGGFLLVRRILR